MKPQLVAREDLQDILDLMGHNYFVQILTDGSYRVSLHIPHTESPQVIEESLAGMVRERNEEHQENENLPADVRPLLSIDFLSDDDVEEFSQFKKYFRKKFLEPREREQLNSWFKKSVYRRENRAPIVTFYSYKGGVGRSTSMAVIARMLSREGKKVVVVDFDLEAPGQSALLGGSQYNSRFGVVDYLIHKPHLREDLTPALLRKNYIVELERIEQKDGALYLMTAGGQHEDLYVDKLSNINFDRYLGLSSNPLDRLFEDLQMALEPDIILVDARTGFADAAGVMFFRYSDLLSVHVYNNAQNKQGIEFLLHQMKRYHQKAEDRMRVIWTDTAVPSIKIKNGVHEEFRNFLVDRLEGFYEEIPKTSMDEAFWDLGLLPYQDELDGASSRDVLDFVKRGANEHYVILKDRILSLVTPVVEKRQLLTKEQKRSILEEMNFGKFVAEEEFETSQDFEKNFLFFKGLEDLFHPNTHLILGAKGVGKSALFTVFREYIEQLGQRFGASHTLKTAIVTGNPSYFETKSGGKIRDKRRVLLPEDLEDLEQKRQVIGQDSMPFWKRFWKVYLWMQVYQEVFSSQDPAFEPLKKAFGHDLDDAWLLAPTFTEEHLQKVVTWTQDRTKLDLIDIWMKVVDEHLRLQDTMLFCLYDHLDKLFSNLDLQSSVVSALLSFWDDVSYQHILPKILLRQDIWMRLNFQNLSHWYSRRKEIQWSKEDLHRLILKRAIENSPTLKSYVQSHPDLYGLGVNGELPVEEEHILNLLTLIFGQRIGKHSKSGLMSNWFYNHLRDAKNTVYPRDALTLLSLARELMIRRSTSWYEYELDRIISGDALTGKSSLGVMSEQRFSALVEEYPYWKDFLFHMRDCKFQFKKVLWQDLVNQMDERDSKRTKAEIEKTLSDLEYIGVLKRYNTGTVDMPDLYLKGFHAQRQGPMIF